MKVNIDGIWVSAEFMPIQIQLSESDKMNIKNMSPEASNYIVFPKDMSWDDAQERLKIKSRNGKYINNEEGD